HDIPRAQAAQWLADFLNKPQAINSFQTMNRYWMEDSFGKYGVQLDAFGPYRLPGLSYQYFQQDFDSSGNHCPNKATTPCNKNFRTDARAAWVAATGQTPAPGQITSTEAATYDNIF